MTPKLRALIDEVLRLDREGTPGKWQSYLLGNVAVGQETLVARCKHNDCTTNKWREDSNLIAHYRSSAPLLARCLEVAVEALERIAVSHGIERAEEALTKIAQAH